MHRTGELEMSIEGRFLNEYRILNNSFKIILLICNGFMFTQHYQDFIAINVVTIYLLSVTTGHVQNIQLILSA